MKKARIAQQETEFQSTILKIKEDIDSGIDKAISEGKYDCRVDFNTTLPNEMRSLIVQELYDAGYYYEMPQYEEPPTGCPMEQWRYYDSIYISWKDNETTNHNRLVDKFKKNPNMIWGWEDEDEI